MSNPHDDAPATGTQSTTARMLGLFAKELAKYPDIPESVAGELVIEAGRRLLDGSAEISVRADV